MKRISVRLILVILLFASGASVAAAQSKDFDVTANPLSQALLAVIAFIDQVLVPLLFAIALIVFIWGVVQAFILGGNNEEKRDDGKKFILWGIIGLFVMTSIWGIVALFVNTFGFTGGAPCLPSFGTREPCAKTAPLPAQESAPCPAGATCIPGTNIPEGIY
jgi:hypothetical protein